MHFNIKRVEKVLLRRKKAKMGKNALFHLLENAPTPALIYHDFRPTSTHAHNYITRSLDSLHPNEQVYMHFNIERVEKVVLRRKKAKMGKTHCFTCFKMRLDLRWSTTKFSQLPHMRTSISPDPWLVYIPQSRSTCIRTFKKVWGRVRGAEDIKRHNALFHLFENASKTAQMYHEILPNSTHAPKYITWSLASVHPTEHVYMH